MNNIDSDQVYLDENGSIISVYQDKDGTYKICEPGQDSGLTSDNTTDPVSRVEHLNRPENTVLEEIAITEQTQISEVPTDTRIIILEQPAEEVQINEVGDSICMEAVTLHANQNRTVNDAIEPDSNTDNLTAGIAASENAAIVISDSRDEPMSEVVFGCTDSVSVENVVLDSGSALKPVLNRSNFVVAGNCPDNDGAVLKTTDAHEEATTDSGASFTCTRCLQIFDRYTNLLTHLTSCPSLVKIEPVESQAKSDLAANQEVFEDSVDESGIDAEKPYVCGSCEMKFDSLEKLVSHAMLHESQNVLCEKCDLVLPNDESLRVHYKTEHLAPEEPDETELSKLECPICNKHFQFDFMLEAHINSHEIVKVAKEKLKERKLQKLADANSETSLAVASVQQKENIVEVPPTNQSLPTPVISANQTKSHNQHLKMSQETYAQNISSLDQLVVDLSPAQEKTDRQILSIACSTSRHVSAATTSISTNTADFRKTTKLPMNSEESGALRYGRPAKHDLMAKTTRLKRTAASKPRKKYNCRWDLVMTDDKPYVCKQCDKAFRWEISLQIHSKEHAPPEPATVEWFYRCDLCPVHPNNCYTSKSRLNAHLQQKHKKNLFQGEYNKVLASLKTTPMTKNIVDLADGSSQEAARAVTSLFPSGDQGKRYTLPSLTHMEQTKRRRIIGQNTLSGGSTTQKSPNNWTGDSATDLHSLLTHGTPSPSRHLLTPESRMRSQPSLPQSPIESATPILRDTVQATQAADQHTHHTAQTQQVTLLKEKIARTATSKEATPVKAVLFGEWAVCLLAYLNELRIEANVFDVIVTGSDGQLFMAHAPVLAAASPYLKELLLSSKQQGLCSIKIETICSLTWQKLLEYFYTGSIQVSYSEVASLAGAAEQLRTDALIDICSSVMQHFSNSETAQTDNVTLQLSSDDWCRELLVVLRDMLERKELCGTSIISRDGDVVFAHGCVLAGCSKVIKGLLQEDQGSVSFSTNTISTSTWQQILQFLYTGQLAFLHKQEMSLVKQAAVDLGFQILADTCA